MLFVLLGTHNADVCPLSNSKTRDLMVQTAPQMPSIAERNGVTMVAGPYVSDEHLVVTVVEADQAEGGKRPSVPVRLKAESMEHRSRRPLCHGRGRHEGDSGGYAALLGDSIAV
jgi:hypothetical protein